MEWEWAALIDADRAFHTSEGALLEKDIDPDDLEDEKGRKKSFFPLLSSYAPSCSAFWIVLE